MTVIGVAFDKILAERKVNPQGRINISNNISIKSVEQSTLFVGKDKQDALKYALDWKTKYSNTKIELLNNNQASGKAESMSGETGKKIAGSQPAILL